MKFRHGFCASCGAVVPLAAVQSHQDAQHTDQWVTLTWNPPIPISDVPAPSFADQLDAAHDMLEQHPPGRSPKSDPAGA